MFPFTRVFNNEEDKRKASLSGTEPYSQHDPARRDNYPRQNDGPLTILVKKNPHEGKRGSSPSTARHRNPPAAKPVKMNAPASPRETFYSEPRRRSVDRSGRNTPQSTRASPAPSKTTMAPRTPEPSRRKFSERPYTSDEHAYSHLINNRGCRRECGHIEDYRDDQNVLCTDKFKKKYKHKGRTIKFTELKIKEQADLIRQPPPGPRVKSKYVVRAKQAAPLSKSLQELFAPGNEPEMTAPYGCVNCIRQKPIYSKCKAFMEERHRKEGVDGCCTVTKHYQDCCDDLPYKLAPNFEKPKWNKSADNLNDVSPLYRNCRSGMCNDSDAVVKTTELHKLQESFSAGYLVPRVRSADQAVKHMSRPEDKRPIDLPDKVCAQCQCRQNCDGVLDYDKDVTQDCKCQCHIRERSRLITRDPDKEWWEKNKKMHQSEEDGGPSQSAAPGTHRGSEPEEKEERKKEKKKKKKKKRASGEQSPAEEVWED